MARIPAGFHSRARSTWTLSCLRLARGRRGANRTAADWHGYLTSPTPITVTEWRWWGCSGRCCFRDGWRLRDWCDAVLARRAKVVCRRDGILGAAITELSAGWLIVGFTGWDGIGMRGYSRERLREAWVAHLQRRTSSYSVHLKAFLALKGLLTRYFR